MKLFGNPTEKNQKFKEEVTLLLKCLVICVIFLGMAVIAALLALGMLIAFGWMMAHGYYYVEIVCEEIYQWKSGFFREYTEIKIAVIGLMLVIWISRLLGKYKKRFH